MRLLVTSIRDYYILYSEQLPTPRGGWWFVGAYSTLPGLGGRIVTDI